MSTSKIINCIDVEATCWEDRPPNVFPETRNEIIEIGLTPIDIKTKTIGESRAIFVLPPTTEITEFCTRLTTLTADFINQYGVPFSEAMDILKKDHKTHRNIFASWGHYDYRSFEKNCKWNNVENPINNLNLNVKALFCAKYGFSGGLAKCAEYLEIPFSGTQHRGIDDSIMVAKILLKLL